MMQSPILSSSPKQLLEEDESFARQTDHSLISNASDCIFHPGPSRKILPSGLVRQKMEDINESVQQADKQRRTEQRFIAHRQSLIRPQMCIDHKFCIGNVPDSPKELMPSQTTLVDGTLLGNSMVTGSGPNANSGFLQGSKDFNNTSQLSNIAPLQRQGTATPADFDAESKESQGKNQVSFNMGYSAIDGPNHAEADAHGGDGGPTRDLSFQMLIHDQQQSRQNPPLDTDLSGIPHSTTQENQARFQTLIQQKNLNNHKLIQDQSRLTTARRDNSLDAISPCRKSKISDGTRLETWQKVVVTKEGIDNWRAQLFGLDIKNFPKLRPMGMSVELFTQLKKEYVPITQMKAKKSGAAANDEDDDNQQQVVIHSRYMDWLKKVKKGHHHKGAKAHHQTRFQDRVKSAQQQSHLLRKEGSVGGDQHTNLSVSDVDTGSHRSLNFRDGGYGEGTRAHSKEPSTERKVPAAKSYKTEIFNKNAYVENDLLSILEPTEEQRIRQQAKQDHLDALEKARQENARMERNRKNKVALTSKQKVHVEKLYQYLEGSVARKELEKTAFNAAVNKRNRAIHSASTNQQRRPSVQKMTAEAKSNTVTEKPPLRKSQKQIVDRSAAYKQVFDGQQQARSNQNLRNSSNYATSTTTTAPHQQNQTSHMNIRQSSYEPRIISKRNSYAHIQSVQKQPSVYAHSSSQSQFKFESVRNKTKDSKKSIYHIFGVKSSQIRVNRQVVQTRPATSTAMRTSSNYQSTTDRQSESQYFSAAQSQKGDGANLPPPTSSKKTIQVVNARSTAAKIVLRNLNQYQRTEPASLNVSTYSNLKKRSHGGSPQNNQKMKHKDSLSFLGQYVNKGDISLQAVGINNAHSVTDFNIQKSIVKSGQTSLQLGDKSIGIDGQDHKPGNQNGPTGANSLSQLHMLSRPSLIRNSTQVDSFDCYKVGKLNLNQQSQEEMRVQLVSLVGTSADSLQTRSKLASNYNTCKSEEGITSKLVQVKDVQQLRSADKNIKIDISVSSDSESGQTGMEYQNHRDQQLKMVDADPNDSVFEYAGILKHAVDHTEKHQKALSSIQISKKSSNVDFHQNVKKEKGSQSRQSLTDFQQCSALFRDFQGELIDQNKEQEMVEEMLTANKTNWNVDTTRIIPRKEQDRRALEKYIVGSRINSTARTNKNFNNPDILIEDKDYGTDNSFGDRRLESFVEPSPKNKNSARHSRLPSVQSPLKKNESLTQRSGQSPVKTVLELEEEEEKYNYDHLYEDSPTYDLHDMLKDESDDEEEHVNFEIKQHFQQPITLANSHGHRNQIKERFYDFRGLSPEQKLELMTVIRDADFWLTKGISMTAHNQLSTAIQCYKQTLILNQNHYVAMQNIAVCYERLDKFTCAYKWFKRASQIAPFMHITLIGACINCFKLGKYQKASDFVRVAILEVQRQKIEKFGDLEHIEKADEAPWNREESNTFQGTLNDYNYMLAMCLRKLKKFEEAGNLYLQNQDFYRYKERISLVESIFGLLLLPMVKDRRMLANELETINDSLKMYKEIRDPIKRPILGTFYTHNKEWVMKFARQAAEELQTRNFFKRFKVKDLAKLLPLMRVRQHKRDTMLFPDFEVCIILDGLIESKYHVFGNRIPKPLSKFKAGSILGFDHGDDGKTSHIESWHKCMSQVEAIWMTRDNFAKLWQLQHQDQRKMLCQIVRMNKCFQHCNDLTVHMIAFELYNTTTYAPGEVIVPIHKRSIINEMHKAKMAPQMNAILKSVLAQRGEVDKFGLDRRVSSWTIMLGQIAGKVREERTQLALLKVQAEKGGSKKLLRSSTIILPGAINLQSLMQPSMPTFMKKQSSVINKRGAGGQKVITNLKRRFQKQLTLTPENYFTSSYPLVGWHVVETGSCKIMHKGADGKKRLVAIIGRNDSFGGASLNKIATLDFLGEIVAGASLNKDDQSSEKPVTVWHLSIDSLQRIPEYELKQLKETMFQQSLSFMQIGARKFKMTIQKMQTY